jgi:hypothetical protein
VYHGDPCPTCGGRGFHVVDPECPETDGYRGPSAEDSARGYSLVTDPDDPHGEPVKVDPGCTCLGRGDDPSCWAHPVEDGNVHRIGARVRLKHDPRVWDDSSIPHSTTGRVVETMRIGFDVRVQWDDGKRRGRFDGWCSWTSIECIPWLEAVPEGDPDIPIDPPDEVTS